MVLYDRRCTNSILWQLKTTAYNRDYDGLCWSKPNTLKKSVPDAQARDSTSIFHLHCKEESIIVTINNLAIPFHVTHRSNSPSHVLGLHQVCGRKL